LGSNRILEAVVTVFLADGKGREVVTKGSPDGFTVLLYGKTFTFRLQETSPGRFVVWRGDRPDVLYCVRDGASVYFAWRGVAYHVLEEREGARTVQRPGGVSLEAPMPGRVIKVGVVPGQAVRKGEEILVIEAMKMENPIRAPKDGIVRSVTAKLGDLVGPGVVLVELE
jgi:biotin carboxyl carrier protein